MRKLFTVKEANAMIPGLRDALKQLQKLKRDFEVQYGELQKMRSHISNGPLLKEDPFFEMEARLEFLNLQARSSMERIRETGVLLKDIEKGLIDFPARRNGRDVLLCWRMEEDEVSHWHHPWEGYHYRKEVDEFFGETL
ncbi:DUF2203 domain-containing protein [Salinithrix halophila]|uniref:DUF2203 domain-containing protein n=1 Tax=Salinithrix halophila TaxID=1485204 RepID=A0ABV8JK62_9BACL